MVLYFISPDHVRSLILKQKQKMRKKPQKTPKNARNARSGPWWDPTCSKLDLETITIVFSTSNGFRNRINLLLILKKRYFWTLLQCYGYTLNSAFLVQLRYCFLIHHGHTSWIKLVFLPLLNVCLLRPLRSQRSLVLHGFLKSCLYVWCTVMCSKGKFFSHVNYVWLKTLCGLPGGIPD